MRRRVLYKMQWLSGGSIDTTARLIYYAAGKEEPMSARRAISDSLIESVKFALVTFLFVTGIVGMILVYAPDEVVARVYLAGLCCGVAAGVIRFVGSILSSR